MQLSFPQFIALATLFGSSLAHFNFEALIVNGAATQPYEYVRRVTNSNSPVTSVDDDNIRCNVGGSNGTWSSTKTQAVNAGDKIGFTINQNIGHPGPVNVYLSKDTGSDVSAYDGSGDWFKIYEEGADANSAGLQWFAAGATTVDFVIPPETPAGDYLVRGDMIALHGAQTAGGAQFYIGCAQVTISSSSTASPPASALMKFPGAYSATEPGIQLNIYYPAPINYTMPGGRPWPDDSTSVVGNATLYADGTAGNNSGPSSAAPSSTPSGVLSPSGASPTGTGAIIPTTASASAVAAIVTPSPIGAPAPTVPAGIFPPSGANPSGTAGVPPAASSLASSFSNIISALPSSVAAAPAPTVIVSAGGDGDVSTAGMSMTQLLELLQLVLTALLGSNSSGGLTAVRRHAREF